MSKPYFNQNISPEISKSEKLPASYSPKVVYHNPLRESVGRLEEQNSEALHTLTQLNNMIQALIELNHTDSKKMDHIAKMQDVLIEEQSEVKKVQENQYKNIEVHQQAFSGQQDDMRQALQLLLKKVEAGTSEVKELKDTFLSEGLSGRFEELVGLIQAIKGEQEAGKETVLEANALQNLLLEEMTRKQAELEKGQKKGFKGILEKLNLIKSENDRSHDTQLENQKLMVDSLYKLLNEEHFMEELKQISFDNK